MATPSADGLRAPATVARTPLRLPAPKEIRDLLTDLLGREVALRPAVPLAPGPMNPATVGVYVDTSLRVVASLVLDLPLSARVGAAVGLVPPVAALDAVEQGRLGGDLRGGVRHVLDVAASLFEVRAGGDAARDGEPPRVRLYAAHHAGDRTPPDVLARTLAWRRRKDVVVDVAGYGAGRLAITLG